MQVRSHWTFLSNHAHVVVALAKDPGLRVRDIAAAVGITERAVAIILSNLEDAGVISKTRTGRRNAYTVHGDVPLRHPVEAHRTVADILRLAHKKPTRAAPTSGTARSRPNAHRRTGNR